MPGGKRKLELFDPNKSDSDDVDYVSGQEREPRKASRKSRSAKKSSSSKRRRTKYGGSDVSEDDLDESIDDSFSEESEEEEIQVDPMTGRRRRKAAAAITYEEPDSDIPELEEESVDESDEVEETPPRKSKVIKLKVRTPAPKVTRSTRSGSVSHARAGTSAEPTSAGLQRRSTRAHTEEGDELVALTTSGRHVEVVRSSKSPETAGRARATRGGKGLKKPASIIKEEIHETSSYEQTNQTEATTEVEMTQEAQDQPSAQDIGANDDDDDELAVNIPEVARAEVDNDDEDEEDDMPITRAGRTRSSRASLSAAVREPEPEEEEPNPGQPSRRLRSKKSAGTRTGAEQSSDFEPVEESAEEEVSDSDNSLKKGKSASDEDSSGASRRGRRAGKGQSKSNRSSRRRTGSDEEEDLDLEELQEEVADLKKGRRAPRPRRDQDILYEGPPPGRRQRKPVDYTIRPIGEIWADDEVAEELAATPSRGPKGRRNGASQAWERNLYTTYGPFGGAGGPTPVIGGPWGTGATGGVDSDSSDDENMARPSNLGGNVGMTPTSAMPPGLLPGMGQLNPADPISALGGTPSNLGKIKSQKALADADPLGVDQNVDFSKVGGLSGHIDQLKEMVQMPLLYPELFLKFHVTPPRGVLFHGPPGTGKTLLARALAAQIGSGGRKITFYMRKGADALSKWVGEAERQLRLLFEEARKTQPSIIFFDEIDGLAPVRSSKQEQIHASIVSTLLALMDGMDGRGQVIVIGATNRPDNIDPALRRPGRFDREFYFPLPDLEARKSIINIHTQDWGIDDAFKDSLAHVTKGYGGADLRALCTEAALNSIQRTYPQIYSSNDKLLVDADKIKVTAKDFMLSVKKMIPSSERATSSGAAPLPKVVEPLLREQLKLIEEILDGLVPVKKKVTALQEAMYEQYDDADQGFGRETLQQEFEKSRIFRPRLLIGGEQGMGQGYIGSALLNHFEGLHVQNFDLPTIYSDSARSAETAIVQLFAEVKRHKPSVIYLPGIDMWYQTLSGAVMTTFMGLLRAIPPTDPVLVLGITEQDPSKVSPDLLRDLFGFSRKNQFTIQRPSRGHREEFFKNIIEYIRKAPKDFPDPVNRKKRKLEVLQIAPPPPPKIPTKEEIKALKKRDHLVLNVCKSLIQPIMDQIQKKYKKFRSPVLQQSEIQYLYDEQDPNFVRPDIVQFRPYELDKDKDGIPGLRQTATGRFFYNLETTTIEERLSNGFYARPKDFLADIRSLAKDSKHFGDRDRLLKANEMLANVEIDIATVEANPALADCENVYQRQLQRAKEKEEKYRKKAQVDATLRSLVGADVPVRGQDAIADASQSGPITLGEIIPGRRPYSTATPFAISGSMSNGYSSPSKHASAPSAEHQMSNGSPVRSHVAGEDVQMGGTDDADAQSTPTESHSMQPPSQFRVSRGISNISAVNTQMSQTSGFQQLPPDTSPGALINDASTTTSGNKSSGLKRSSDGSNTQVTNGKLDSQYSPTEPNPADRDLPDTQRDTQNTQQRYPFGTQETHGGNSGEEQWLHSQAHGLARGHIAPNYSQTPSSGSQAGSQPRIPHFDAPPRHLHSAPLTDILNKPGDVSSSTTSSQDPWPIDEEYMSKLLADFTRKTGGCSIEQLEQINRELMDTIWKMRGDHNRMLVATQVLNVFNDTIVDIEQMQKLLQLSQ